MIALASFSVLEKKNACSKYDAIYVDLDCSHNINFVLCLFGMEVFDKRPHPDDSVSVNHRAIPITLNPKVTKAVTDLGLSIQDSGFLEGLHKWVADFSR